MIILNGKIIAQKIKDQLKAKIAKSKIKPSLAVILVGKNESSKIYISQKEKMARELKVNFKKYILPDKIKEEKIIRLIEKLNGDKNINGILVQLPLPKHLDTNKIIQTINFQKDVDGFNNPKIISPTIAGILELLKATKLNLKNKKACLLTKSDIFTKSLESLLKNKGVKIVNQTKKADILIVALGKPKFVKSEMLKKGVSIIDVGYSRIDGKPVGDVDFKNVAPKTKFISPVPGGVGPLTVIFLFKNLFQLFLKQKN